MRFTYILYDAYDFVHIQLLARSVEAWWCEYGYVLAIVFWNVCQSSWWDCIGSGLYIVGSNQISFRVDTFDSLTNTKSLYYIVVVLIDHSLHREKNMVEWILHKCFTRFIHPLPKWCAAFCSMRYNEFPHSIIIHIIRFDNHNSIPFESIRFDSCVCVLCFNNLASSAIYSNQSILHCRCYQSKFVLIDSSSHWEKIVYEQIGNAMNCMRVNTNTTSMITLCIVGYTKSNPTLFYL